MIVCQASPAEPAPAQELEVAIDSGAYDVVIPSPLCSDIPLRASEQERSGLEYEVANSQSIPNERGTLVYDDDTRGTRAEAEHVSSG